jgi:micrococcal nuclease
VEPGGIAQGSSSRHMQIKDFPKFACTEVMKKAYKKIPLIINFLLILPTVSLAGQFKVTWIQDGDTIKAEGYDIEIKVRLIGIDAADHPRLPYAIEAKRHLAKMIWDRTVEIRGYGLGPANRVLGVIHLNGKNINLEMVRAGLTVAYRGRLPEGFDLTPYLEAETEAREAKKGMWSSEV